MRNLTLLPQWHWAASANLSATVSLRVCSHCVLGDLSGDKCARFLYSVARPIRKGQPANRVVQAGLGGQ